MREVEQGRKAKGVAEEGSSSSSSSSNSDGGGGGGGGGGSGGGGIVFHCTAFNCIPKWLCAKSSPPSLAHHSRNSPPLAGHRRQGIFSVNPDKLNWRRQFSLSLSLSPFSVSLFLSPPPFLLLSRRFQRILVYLPLCFRCLFRVMPGRSLAVVDESTVSRKATWR